MKIYFPIHLIDVPASPPHPPETCYRVSFGREHWGDDLAYVYKVQMVYEGAVSGRKSPSYPDGTDDWKHVEEAMHELKGGGGHSGRGLVQPVGGERHE